MNMPVDPTPVQIPPTDAPSTLFSQPLLLLGTAVLAPLLAASSTGFCGWLLWERLDTTAKQAQAIGLTALPVFFAVVALGLLLARPRKPVPLPVSLGFAGSGIAYLVFYFSTFFELAPSNTPDWMISASHPLIVTAGIIPMIAAGVWRLAAMPLPIRPATDWVGSICLTLAAPIGGFALITLFSALLRWNHESTWNLWGYLLIPLFLLGPLAFFIGLLRCLTLGGRLLIDAMDHKPWLARTVTTLVALILPLGGLLLNITIPFPSDFQNVWPYTLTALTALFLLLPGNGSRRDTLLLWLARWSTFPFTLYFFLIFLPFLPLAILAMLAVGVGFLILAPLLLFWLHLAVLARSFRGMAATWGRRTAIATALAAVLAMPAILLVETERDRAALHGVLDLCFAPDYTSDAKLPASPARIKRILTQAQRFKNGVETPLLSAWYTQRVFDGMLLPDARFDTLWHLLIGGTPPAAERDADFGNVFGSLFARNTARSRSSRWNDRRGVPRDAFLAETSSTSAVTNGEQIVTVRLTLRTGANARENMEYAAPLRLPAGVWVGGLRLKIGDTWEQGAIVERKAAEWVYQQITRRERRDPAILTLESPQNGLLRVFPVPPNEVREVELTFIMPAGFAHAVQLGDTEIAWSPKLPDSARACFAAGVLVASPAWIAHQAEPLRESTTWTVIDCSAETGLTSDAAEALLRAQPAAAFSKTFTLLAANAETRTAETSLTMLCPALDKTLLPRHAGLDAARTLRQIVRQHRTNDSNRQVVSRLRILLVGDGWSRALAALPAGDWQAIRDEAPDLDTLTCITSTGNTTSFPVPDARPTDRFLAVRIGTENRLLPATDQQAAVFFTANSDPIPAPATLDGKPLPDLTMLGSETRWARGARAWRLQRLFDEQPRRRELRRTILAASRTADVQTTCGSSIVVEDAAQRKMLLVRQAEALGGHQALDFDDPPDNPLKADAPGALLLGGGLMLVLLLRRLSRRRT